MDEYWHQPDETEDYNDEGDTWCRDESYPGYDGEEEDCCGYISSDEEQVDSNSVSSLLECLRKNPIDGDLIEDLINLLERYNHNELAYQMAKIGLDTCPGNGEIMDALGRIPALEDHRLITKLQNIWLMSQQYIHDSNLLVKEIVGGKYMDPGSSKDGPDVDLAGIVAEKDKVPSFPDTMIVIPSGSDYRIFRKFHVEPFQIYGLKIRFAITRDVDVALVVNTEDGIQRLNYKLSGSQIQYNFNSLNQRIVEIGLQGKNRKNDGAAQLRLMELSLMRKSDQCGLDNSLRVRHLSPSIPIIANMLIGPEDLVEGIRDTLESLIDQVDRVNIYLSNIDRKRAMELSRELINVKYVVKTGNEGRLGLFRMSEEAVGYQLMVGAGIIYHLDYVALMLSKLVQYGNRSVVGLRGIQLTSNYSDWKSSKKIILPIMTPHQDIRCHILGVETMAFMSGILGSVREMERIAMDINGKAQIDDNHFGLLLAVMAQDATVGMICVERVEKMIKYHNRAESRMSDQIGGESGEKIIRSIDSWRYY